MSRKRRIPLSPGFHAEAGETKGHQHSIYTTLGELHGYERIHVGTLTKKAVEAWAGIWGEWGAITDLEAENASLRDELSRAALSDSRTGAEQTEGRS